ncbi:MAG: lipase [Deltaproteobacteria bacterium]|nr:lipase [Deltaproteobacteria bacterium]
MKGIRLTLVALTFLAIALAPSATAQSGITPHFDAWLSSHGYGGHDFARGDVPGGSYGGKTGDGDTVVNQPVIFIHGNGDSALGTGTVGMTGWSASLAYFQSKGYKSSELYATTWGPADTLQTALQYHSRSHLERLRAFIQAVKAYTGAAKVDIVAHSMGVTLARKAIKGGAAYDSLGGGAYDLGASLTSSVDSFVGIAGGNRGLVACYLTGPTTPTCGNTNGLYPGYLVGFYGPFGVSEFLVALNSTSRFEGSYRFSIWSTVDEVIGYGDLVYGRYTSQIPGQTGEKRYGTVPYGHFGCKDQTGAVQWKMVTAHSGY